jgi:hydrogenase-4 component E
MEPQLSAIVMEPWQVNAIKGLCTVLLITASYIAETKKLTNALKAYVVQVLILSSIFLVIGIRYEWFIVWAISAVVTKATLVPYFISRTIRKTREIEEEKPYLPTTVSMAIVFILILFSAVISKKMQHLAPGLLKIGFVPLCISISLTLIGLLLITTRRNAVKQIFGVCHIENGIHLLLATSAFWVPETVEIGIATDAVMLVAIMCIFAYQLYKLNGSLDVGKLILLRY